jgi:translation initiation factor 6
MIKVFQTDFEGDHNLGLFAKASDKICLAGNVVSDKVKKEMENILNVPLINVLVSDTNLCGLFIAINSNGILLPKIVSENEIKKFKTICKEFDMNLEILNSKYTAIGNLILCNDKGAIISKFFSKNEKRKIQDCLNVETEYSTIARINTVGSAGLATNKGCLLHRDAEESEIILVKDLLKVDVGIGTANFGSPFVGSCIVANSNGCIVGLSTTGYEISRIMETFKI